MPETSVFGFMGSGHCFSRYFRTCPPSRALARNGNGENMITNPDALLTRRQTAKALTDEGYPTAETTLATKAVRGGGPKPKVRRASALSLARHAGMGAKSFEQARRQQQQA